MNATDEGPVGDVEFYLADEGESQTLKLGSVALSSGDSVPSAQLPK